MKAFALTFFILCSGCIFVESVNLNCEFRNDRWSVLGDVNTCRNWYQGDIITDISNREVTTIDGSTSTNPSVKAFWIYDSNFFYFPHGLQNFFNDLQAIWIEYSGLREVRREDLKEFTNLRELSLVWNVIQFLEPNLFEFNPRLELIYLHSNRIAYIDPNVFNNFVGKLSYLSLSRNICKFRYAYYDISKANEIIEKVKRGKCNDATVLPTTTTTATPITTTITILTTTTTPITTTTTILTTTIPKPSISSAEFEALKKLISDLTNKIEIQNSEIKDELKEVKEQKSEIKVELKEVKDELKALKDEQTETKKKLDDQNLEMKAGFGNITAQNQQRGTSGGDNIAARLEFIEKQLSRLHFQTNLP